MLENRPRCPARVPGTGTPRGHALPHLRSREQARAQAREGATATQVSALSQAGDTLQQKPGGEQGGRALCPAPRAPGKCPTATLKTRLLCPLRTDSGGRAPGCGAPSHQPTCASWDCRPGKDGVCGQTPRNWRGLDSGLSCPALLTLAAACSVDWLPCKGGRGGPGHGLHVSHRLLLGREPALIFCLVFSRSA